MHVTSDGKYILMNIIDDSMISLLYYADLSEYLRDGIKLKLNSVPLASQLGYDFIVRENK